jgi:NADPH:quinone reductase-like Zn-dependent oxidoreductase
MQRLFAMLEKRQLRVRIGHSLPLERAVEAFRLLEQRSSVGKVVDHALKFATHK